MTPGVTPNGQSPGRARGSASYTVPPDPETASSMRDPRRFPRLARLSLWFALGGLAACKAPTTEREQRVVDAVHAGQFAAALEHAKRLAEANPRDVLAQQLYRDAQVAYILDRGRDEVFHGDLTRALALFDQARSLAPEHPTVMAWIAKTRSQLAEQWLDKAVELTAPEQLDEAELCYEKVLEYEPGNIPAQQGLAEVLLLKNYRSGMSKTYFDDGLSSFKDLQLEQARRAFQISRRYRENEPASVRAGQVEKMMAEERLTQAKDLEASGRYFAARNEYRLVLLIEPTNAEGRAGLDRMDREARAVTSLAEADMAIRRGAYDEAEESLAAAGVLTDAQKDELSLLQSGIEDHRLAQMYDAAMSLWHDNRLPEAVKAFDELLAVAPEYRDAARRKATIEEFISMAEEFYAMALAAKNDDDAADCLRAIEPIYPEYKDVAERLRAIEARRAAAEGDESGGSEPPAPAPRDGGGG